MERLIHSRLTKILSIALVSTAALYGLTKSTSAKADFFPQLEEFACLADYSDKNLTCTANDIRVSQVTNVTNLDGTTPVECVLGEKVTFKADVTVETTANERYGYGIWLPEGNWSAMDRNTDYPKDITCSVLIGDTYGPGVAIDEDVCADISKASGFSPVHVYENEEITLFCRDDDKSGKAEFNYCASWNQQEYDLCTATEPTPAGSPSKCRCESFDIDVFISPEPPTGLKELTSASNTVPEPGTTFNYRFSFDNPNEFSSLFITSLTDQFDIGGDGLYSEHTIDLWGGPQPVLAADGVYLTASTCTQPPSIDDGPVGEIPPLGNYTCTFSVQVVGVTLPSDPWYINDVVSMTLQDKNGNPVKRKIDEITELPIETCPDNINSGDIEGLFCSNEISVNITGVQPDIEVTKVANPDWVLENGDDVDFTITVDNLSDDFDSPMTLTYLNDDKFGDLLTDECSGISTSIPYGGTYSCTFTKFIGGNVGQDHTNVVTAKAVDDENVEATDSDNALVEILDVPSDITLDKTAFPTSVPETGDDPSSYADVDYTFKFTVDPNGVDTVYLDQLVDNIDGVETDLTSQCDISMNNEGVVNPAVTMDGYALEPGEWASCVITLQVQGNVGDPAWDNTATIFGNDADGQAVEDDDVASVSFDPNPPQTDMDLATSLLVVVGLQNTGTENVNLKVINVLGYSVFTEESPDDGSFKLLNEGGKHDGVTYGACEFNHLITYNDDFSTSDEYYCAFTVELYPGIENSEDVDFLAPGGVVVTVEDNEGAFVQNTVSLEVHTSE